MLGGTAFFRAAAAPGWAATTGIAVSCGPTGVPSKASAGCATGVAAKINATMNHSNIRITLFLARPTWMGNGTIHRGSDLLGILPQRTGRMICLARPPFGFTFGEFRVTQFYVKRADVGVDFDDVAVAQQRNRVRRWRLPARHGRCRSRGWRRKTGRR